MTQYSVAILEKDPAIFGGSRLVLGHLACSDLVNITLLDHLGGSTANFSGGRLYV